MSKRNDNSNIKNNGKRQSAFKKVAATILIAALVVSTGAAGMSVTSAWAEPVTTTSTTTATATTTATKTFSDLNGHWAKSIIEEAASRGIVGGYPEGDFKPNNLMKREEFFKLVTNVLTVKPDISNTDISKFGDIYPNEWYVDTVKTAVEAGITDGNTSYSFGIGMMITRQEAAKVVSSILQENTDISQSQIDKGLEKFENISDKGSIYSWAYDHVKKVFSRGYMQGDDTGKFNPTNALTRAEAATLLLNVVKSEDILLGPKQSAAEVPATTGSAVTTDAAVTTPPAVDDGEEDEDKDKDDEKVIGESVCNHFVTEGAFTVGKGSSRDPFEISTAAQLNHIREHLDEEACFVLTKNITISTDFETTAIDPKSKEANWSEGNFKPIGTSEKPFIGSFDGDGYAVEGLHIEGTVPTSGSNRSATSNVGLFGYIGAEGVVENLTIEDSQISGNQYVGGIAGYNKGTIADCVIDKDCKITAANNVGGIAGITLLGVEDCTNKGTIEATAKNAGGIAGNAQGGGEIFVDCQNEGSIKGVENVGGIAGYVTATSDDIEIKECANTGKVESTSAYMGGIAGYIHGKSNNLTISDCQNKGDIVGTGVGGGIVGYGSGDVSEIINCYNEGKIEANNVGGIVGTMEGEVSLCVNYGKVNGTAAAGGIAAYLMEEGSIQDCRNEGTIYSNNNAGGIVGDSRDMVRNCYNIGEVSGESVVGGIAGKNRSSVKTSYNIGKITADNGAGSLAGRNMGTIDSCYWIEGSANDAVGMSDSGAARKSVLKLTEVQLSGQEKIKVSEGYVLITDIINTAAGKEKWKFTYSVEEAASTDKMVQKGNTIKTSDLTNNTYLYPCLVDLK